LIISCNSILTRVVQQTAKVGLAVSLEIAGEELMEQQEKADPASMVPPPF
jgi:mitochondrial import receptor subunit TOM40